MGKHKLNSVKLWILIIMTLIAVGFAALKIVNGETFIAFQKHLLSLFFGANVLTKYSYAAKAKVRERAEENDNELG